MKSLGLYYIPHTRTPPIYLSLPQPKHDTTILLILQIIARSKLAKYSSLHSSHSAYYHLLSSTSIFDNLIFLYELDFVFGCGSRPIIVMSFLLGPYTQYILPAAGVLFSR